MGQMDGMVAIVTGASRGLGRAVAREYAKEGASVVICARSQSPTGLAGTLEETASGIRNDGGVVLALDCDVTDESQVNEMARQAMERFGRIDALFNNAGAMVLGESLLEIDARPLGATDAGQRNRPLSVQPGRGSDHDGAAAGQHHQHRLQDGHRPRAGRRRPLQRQQGGGPHVQLLPGRRGAGVQTSPSTS